MSSPKRKADQDAAVRALYHFARNPDAFALEAFEHSPDGRPVKLEAWQIQALKALGSGELRISIKSGNGVGKSAFLAICVLWFLTTRYPCKVPCTANSQSQLFDVLWSEIGAWHRCMKPAFRQMIEIKADRVEMVADPKNSFAVARTARREQPEALQGYHSENLLFIVDEASGVDDLIFEVASGSMSTPGAITILTGNPTRTEGFFFNSHTRNKEGWWTLTVPCSASSRVSPEYEQKIISDYGMGNVYRVRVLGEFPLAEDDVLIPRTMVEAAITRDVMLVGPEIWGVDVARFGDDRSALAKRRGNGLLEPIKFWRDKDSTQIAGLIAAEYAFAKNKPVEICVDIIGIGSGVYDALRNEHDLPAKGVNVAERPSIDGKYERQRDELWFRMKEWFSDLACKIPNDKELIEEVSSVRYDFSRTSQKLKVESKDSMRARGMRSPDLAESLLMTFASNQTSSTRQNKWGTRGPLQPDSRGIY